VVPSDNGSSQALVRLASPGSGAAFVVAQLDAIRLVSTKDEFLRVANHVLGSKAIDRVWSSNAEGSGPTAEESRLEDTEVAAAVRAGALSRTS
jgi:hypothetical protein